VNESRPGVAAKVLNPEEALERYKAVKRDYPNVSVAGIAGPGDALANFSNVEKTLSLIREVDKDITFCISTNGLRLPEYAEALDRLGVSHLTVTMNTLDEAVGARIYRFVDFNGQRYTRKEGARLLLKNQQAGLEKAAKLGLVIKVNIVMLKGLNEDEIPRIVSHARDLGASITNIMQLIPVKGTLFEGIPLTSRMELDRMRLSCAEILPQMYHCQHCRSDAIGTLDEDASRKYTEQGESSVLSNEAADAANLRPARKAGAKPLRFAVASRNGMCVDLHFGHASSFYIYEKGQGEVDFLERRDVSQACGGPGNCGGEDGDAFEKVFDTLHDVDALITLRVGERPKRYLEERGINVFLSCDYVAQAVKDAALKIQELK
jgi:nitrogenase cofactor biosynthesis protein NifB